MSKDLSAAVKEICLQYSNDRTCLMDILRKVQADWGSVSDEAIDVIAGAVSIPRVEVESTVTFYAFLSKEKKGKIVIRLCNDIIDRLAGMDVVAQAFKDELGIDFGETTPDGLISLEYTPCIGMSDQAPAGVVNDEVITYLSTDKAREIVRTLKKTGDPKKLVSRLGDGKNADPLVNSMVHNNIRKKGEVIFADYPDGAGLKKTLTMSPVEVINEVTNARLRGRGGAGFPAGMKWQFTRAAEDPIKYVICNADEGEPGTFKDRVLLTEYPERLFEGMTIAGYAIGAQQGIVYLRAEYAYLLEMLENVLDKRRKNGMLGKSVLGKKEFDFDINIQLGAGAYVCGEETALISSCEGTRGDPKNRPPFPAQKGYMGHPTCVNNVETYVAAVRLMDMGAAWFTSIGSKGSSGTKLLSISGDCHSPGVYEYPFGITIEQLLKDVGAENAKAVQIGGASGQMIGKEDYKRTICYDDLATGGSIMIFGAERDILDVVKHFMEFFVEESCGYCTPCRVGNVLLKGYLERIMAGNAEESDLEIMKSLGNTVKVTSRCGLGQTSPNPILTTLDKFYPEYKKLLKTAEDGFKPSFNIQDVLQESQSITGRKSVHFS